VPARRSFCGSYDTRVDGAGVSTPATGGLRGRKRECALLDDLTSAIRRGESRTLVLLGEAGAGKTALLEYLIASASDMSVVRAVGGDRFAAVVAFEGAHAAAVPDHVVGPDLVKLW
jgi:hypothetical protein